MKKAGKSGLVIVIKISQSIYSGRIVLNEIHFGVPWFITDMWIISFKNCCIGYQ